jgi:serine protease Do
MKTLQKLLTLSALLISASVYASTDDGVIRGLPDFTPIVTKYSSAVVHIMVTLDPTKSKAITFSNEKDQDAPPKFQFPPDFPPELLPHSNKKPNAPEPPMITGSGFIVTTTGYILTNAHVVDEAAKVVVHLTDQHEYVAKVVGFDERSDVAVIKIDTKNPLPTVLIGDSSTLHPGQWVVAMGAPFRFDGTTTAGIVSAVSRATRDSTIPFIQTDVAINPGNSGGPLFNMRGEVIGINSQIWSQSGGFEGIAFSIPINIALHVEEQLIKTGHVVYGRMGVGIVRVDQEAADVAGLDPPHGALVVQVAPDGPGVAAGIKSGDIIVNINGTDIIRSFELPALVGNIPPGTLVNVQLVRNKKLMDVSVIIAEMKDEPVPVPTVHIKHLPPKKRKHTNG